MYRVVRTVELSIGAVKPSTDSKATCTQCGQWVDCAQCSGCKDTKCLPCYNGKKKLPQVHGDIAGTQDDE